MAAAAAVVVNPNVAVVPPNVAVGGGQGNGSVDITISNTLKVVVGLSDKFENAITVSTKHYF